MATEQQNNVLLTIDPRKSRIRLHKTTLHALGDPKFIQFLISQKQRSFGHSQYEKFLQALRLHYSGTKHGSILVFVLKKNRLKGRLQWISSLYSK